MTRGAPSPRTILDFWFRETKPFQWWRRDAAFDRTVALRFGAAHEAAAAGKLGAWRSDPARALALIILLDQFSRNIWRDDPRAFAQDEAALAIADEAIRRRFDFQRPPNERAFFYMPFMHSEDLLAQEHCVSLFRARLPGSVNVRHAEEHRDIVKRFGRFPHRNKVLGRESTAAEIAFLNDGGFNP